MLPFDFPFAWPIKETRYQNHTRFGGSCDSSASSGNTSMEEGSMEELDSLLTEEEQLIVTTRLHQVLRPFVLRRMKESIDLHIPEKVMLCV